MKVLVTGAGGFLGTHVMAELLKHGYTDIRAMVRDTSKAERIRALAAGYPEASVEIFSGNLCSKQDARRAVADRTLIFHLAAGLKGSAAELFLNSVVSSSRLIEAVSAEARETGSKPRIVLVSSFGVYGTAAMSPNSLIDERSPLERNPGRRDPYSYSKLRQELLFWEAQPLGDFDLVVLRPGVIYGPGGGHFSTRVGIQVGPLFFHLGGDNLMPMSYVENCASAIVHAGGLAEADQEVFNVHDDDLPTAAQYLKLYRQNVKPVRAIRLPYFLTRALAAALENYHRRSGGQLPAILTPYKAAALWGGNRFSNLKLRGTGWSPKISTHDGIERTFAFLREHKEPHE